MTSIIQATVQKFREALARANVNRRRIRQLERRIEKLESSVTEVQQSTEANFDFDLSHIPTVMPLMIIDRVLTHEDSLPGSPTMDGNKMFYWRARRMEVTPTSPPTLIPHKWRVDPDYDTVDYIVLATPGNTGYFKGCRFWGMLSHDWEFRNSMGATLYQGEVVIGIAGEQQGFEARITGPGTNPTLLTKLKFWNWSQFNSGLSKDDSRVSGQVIAGVGGASDFTLPVALQLESVSFDSAMTYMPIDSTFAPRVTLRFVNQWNLSGAPDAGFFVISHATHPATSAECPS